MAILSEIRSSVRGCVALLSFRSDWRDHFDFSGGGVARSFIGLLLSIPALTFTLSSINHLVVNNPADVNPDSFFFFWEGVRVWARMWLIFPFAALIPILILGLKDRYASWLVAHNWMVFVLIHVQAGLWAIYMAGLADAQSMAMLASLFINLRYIVHWRVAAAALGLPAGLSAGAAGIPILAELIFRTALGG